ncbi:hypothetical protein ACULTK_004472 [Yersinia enterocolitica]|uniref:hypothetical protein n=1 Tax=Yersinia enterocolitica TaxID=630 RepID=UPI0005E35C82|nr:hypothetical protein [Yersinia enterocolitica]EKN3971092.1 hypothetical protein [Yersinia enterocolitica]UYK00405.1 hypothetical protein N4221_14440 [Yersinia enterocolitica]CNI61873.1 Uncharacterised protein [Yersinia enterocolitica]HDL8516396.1 hypothetical protein [Yersinia enterocolitica]HDL8556186.1 hypothetical protein [Yersinia enterocolitica]
MTDSGLLLHGVEANGKVHFDFTVRLPVIRDTINALSDTQDKYGTTEGAVASTYYRVAVIASALTTLGDLDKDVITTDLLLDALTDDDYDLIDTQISAIKKKRMALNPNLPVIDSPSSPSVSTE